MTTLIEIWFKSDVLNTAQFPITFGLHKCYLNLALKTSSVEVQCLVGMYTHLDTP